MNFSYSPLLRDFTKATNIRLRFLRTNTLLGHLMGKALRDPTVTRRVSWRAGGPGVGGGRWGWCCCGRGHGGWGWCGRGPVGPGWCGRGHWGWGLMRRGHLGSGQERAPRADVAGPAQYYYSIKDISIGGRCVCHGHADVCDAKDPTDPFR